MNPMCGLNHNGYRFARSTPDVRQNNATMRKQLFRDTTLGFLLLSLPACGIAQSQSSQAGAASAGGQLSAAAKPHDADYLIGSGDVLAINVWKEPDISRALPVRPDGRISLPLVGELQAAGKTPLQLEHDIAAKLRAYITEADVTVIVQQVNSEKINVLGRVMKPGAYPLSGITTILDAIAAAGGFQEFAKQKSIYVLRSDSVGHQTRIAFNYKEVIKGKHPEQNIRLQSHDTLVVP
jgi:polysaccharide export outer membrane protein